MGLVAKDGGSFIDVPPGIHLARCYRLVDLGTQKSEFQGKVKYLEKVMMQFEIHGEDDQGNPLVTQDGRPLSIAKSFTVTLADKSTLRKDLQTWRGREFTAEELRGFELKNVLGKWCMITVTQTESNGKIYTNIASISPVASKIKQSGMPEGINELKIFEISDPDMELFDSFSENLKNKIKSSPEWQNKDASFVPEFDTKGLDDDKPF